MLKDIYSPSPTTLWYFRGLIHDVLVQLPNKHSVQVEEPSLHRREKNLSSESWIKADDNGKKFHLELWESILQALLPFC